MKLDFEGIMRLADRNEKKRLIISGQEDPHALDAVIKARDRGWVEPVACGRSFSNAGSDMEIKFSSIGIEEARREAMDILNSGNADILLDTGPLGPGILSLIREKNMDPFGNSVLSYVNAMVAPKDGRLTLLTDTIINNRPDIKKKIGIVNNVIRIAKALGIEEPKIAALAPLELVNPAIPSTLDAAILSKMSERGQFGDALVEGPLAMDNAESGSAAKHKGINSPVPGDLDVYFFPDLESANLMSQILAWPGKCKLAGVITGTINPVVIRSPLEAVDSWSVNLALGLIS